MHPMKILNPSNLVPLITSDEYTNTQACLAVAQNPKEKESEEIEVISRASIDPEDVVVVSTTVPMVFLRDNLNVGESSNLLLRVAAYETGKHRTVLSLQNIKETEMEIRT